MSNPTAAQPEPRLRLDGIVKRFGSFTANDDVALSVQPGERHALLGENGAGKSTLVKIIYGLLQPDAGEIRWDGTRVTVPSPSAARSLGVGMVFQHFSVFDALTVAENVALALPDLPMRGLDARIAAISAEYGLPIDPGRDLYTLSAGEKQRVEIIRVLLQDPALLIFDEPTSVLTPQEAETLFGALDRLAAEGRSILYISHRLDEVRRFCDQATVLRRGKVVASCDPRAETARSMAEMMVGTRIGSVSRTPHATGDARLVLDRLSLPSTAGTALEDISLSVAAGEVVGIAGIAGEGQAELMAAISGERRAMRADAVALDGVPVGLLGPTARRQAGLAAVPEDRLGHAAVPAMSLDENVILSHHTAAGLAPGGIVDRTAARDWTKRIVERFDVRAGSANPAAASLSGGNLQKFVVGREILRSPGILAVNQPTWGVDAGAAAVIRQALLDLAAAGAAVLVISQDLDEVFEIADRIAVLHRGQLSVAMPADEITRDDIGLLMTGAAAA